MQQRLEGVFDPQELTTVYQAFDEAWKELAPWFENDAASAQAAKVRLAMTALALAGREEPETNPARLTRSLLQAFQWRAGGLSRS